MLACAALPQAIAMAAFAVWLRQRCHEGAAEPCPSIVIAKPLLKLLLLREVIPVQRVPVLTLRVAFVSSGFVSVLRSSYDRRP